MPYEMARPMPKQIWPISSFGPAKQIAIRFGQSLLQAQRSRDPLHFTSSLDRLPGAPMPPARSLAAGLRRRGVLLSIILLLLLLLHRMTSSPRPGPVPALRKPFTQACDYSSGEWVRDASAGSSLRYDHTCKEIFKGWNCIANGKTNGRDLLQWRWRPSDGCELPWLDPLRFLERHRNTNIGLLLVPPLPCAC
jgi:hypothetical protein